MENYRGVKGFSMTSPVYKLLTCISRFTGTLVAVDLVDAGPIVAGIALAVVNIDFTVDSCQTRCFVQ